MSGADTTGETILIVEDDQQVRQLIRLILTAAGYDVLDADGGDEALRLVRSHDRPIQLLLTDVVLPSASGPQIALDLAPSYPGLKVLYMSGYTDDVLLRHGVAGGGIAFLPKPFAPQALVGKVREVLAGRLRSWEPEARSLMSESRIQNRE